MMFKVNKGKLEGYNHLSIIDQLRQLVDVSSGMCTISRGPGDLTYPHASKKRQVSTWLGRAKYHMMYGKTELQNP